MSNTLLTYSACDLLNLLKKRDISALEVCESYISQMEKIRPLNAFVTETSDVARQNALESDKRYKSSSSLPLDGLPFAHKDLFATEGILTSASSKILSNFIPPYESTVSQKLKKNGIVLMGKTNMDEFAMGSSTITSHYGPSLNPWVSPSFPSTPLVPGGSSGGSTAAVAAFAAIASTGTDTGGSIRQPASYCGLVGIKPSYGRCSRYGIVAFASSLDQAGVHTRCVKDAALFLQYMAGHDSKDSTSAKVDVPAYIETITGDIKGKRIGIPKEYRPQGLSEDIARLWDKGIALLKERGAIIEEISLPHTDLALPTYYILAPAEASSNLARYDGVRFGVRNEHPGDTLNDLYEHTRGSGFGAEVKRRIFLGTYVLSTGFYDAYFLKAQKVRFLIAEDFKKAFESGIDFILTPTTPSGAFSVENPPKDPIEMYLNDVFTVPSSLAGLPAISVPAGLSEKGLPLGLQLIAPAFQESALLNVAYALEDALEFKGLTPETIFLPNS
ncbi:MAG: Asp-tRNA(Asn)/Glu-tRNA(Gln) amidotransferase subunit GatA [Proteobacteria bacterium]|nr:Asp-tRNA(Asn)/Glu-tRNA(Gln) amidotransferase subunit GatA [Pseudomonadota bacterium]